MNFTIEQLQQARKAKSAEELFNMAKSIGVEMTEEQARTYFTELHKEGELSDEELDMVAGGKNGSQTESSSTPEPKFHNYDKIKTLSGGQYVYYIVVHDAEWDNGEYYYDLYNDGDGSWLRCSESYLCSNFIPW